MARLMASALDLMERLQSAASTAAAWSVYMDAARDVGLSYGAAAHFSPAIKVAEAVFADSMPCGWLAHYSEQGHERHSPMMQRQYGAAAFSWRMSDWDGQLDADQRRWRDDNLGAGILHGYSIPSQTRDTLKIITLCGSSDAPDREDLIVLRFAALALFDRLEDLGASTGSARHASPALSAREAECLTWVANGKSDWEIGEILGLSQKTVNHYVERAKLKLNSSTRVQAVVVALRSGMIQP